MTRRRLKIVPAQSNTDGDCIRFLTRLQRRAVRGEFQSVAVVANDGSCGSGWAGDLKVFTMLGGLQHLSHRLNAEEIE